MKQDIKLADRLEDFCADFDIPEKHHGSLRLLSGMAFVLGLEITLEMSPREERSECPTEL